MNIEAWKLQEQEKLKKKLSEKEKTFEKKRNLDLQHKQEKLQKSEQVEDNLNSLKDLLEDWKLDSSTAQLVENITSNTDISEQQIQEIFEKIEQIENNENISKYLPEETIITKDEYKKSLTDDIFRTQTLTKLSTALTILAQHANPNAWMWINLFTWFMAVLDKNLIIIQENHIDIQDSLKQVEEKKNPKIKLSFWNKIKDFLQELSK